MKNLKLAFLALALCLVPMLAEAQQYTLTQTSLSAQLSYGTTCFTVASTSGITVQTNTNATDVYIDRELIQVTSVNSTTGQVCGLRGVSGTQAATHASGAMVLAGAPAAFLNYDPSGVCSTSAPKSPPEAVPAQPTINTRTGAQAFCSSVTGTWVRGFGPQISTLKTGLSAAQTGATITPAGPYFQFSGTTALVTINVPVGASDGDQITIEFTGSGSGLTWTAAGNISVLGTATSALSSVTFTYNAATSKWIPSRVA
jgi:hypothetical protein